MCKFENGRLTVPGLTIINPGDRPEARLSLEDFGPRTTKWIRQITIHTTGGHWPQPLLPGAGPAGHAVKIARYWKTNPEYGGAPFVIDFNGDVWLLTDPFKNAVWHATTVNDWSIGIEMCTTSKGEIYQATLDACLTLVLALCELCGIPFQTSSHTYARSVIPRLKDGGKYVVGVFGHRDNAWVFPWQFKYVYKTKEKIARAHKLYPQGYANRGQGDPGDEIFRLMRRAGAMQFNYDKLEDLTFWKSIQAWLNRKSMLHLEVDGVYGPDMHAAMKACGAWRTNGVFTENPML